MNKDLQEYVETSLMALYDGMQGYSTSMNIRRTEFHESGITYYLNNDSDTVAHDQMKDTLNNRANILMELDQFNLVPLQSCVSFTLGRDCWEVTVTPCLVNNAPDDLGDAALTFLELMKPTNLNQSASIKLSFKEEDGIMSTNFEHATVGDKDEFKVGSDESEGKYPVSLTAMAPVKKILTEKFIDAGGVLQLTEIDQAIEGYVYGKIISELRGDKDKSSHSKGWDIAGLNVKQKIKWWLVSSYV